MDIGQDPRWAMDDLIYPMEPDGERRTRDGHPIMHDISCSFGTLGPEMGSDVYFGVYLNGPPSPLPDMLEGQHVLRDLIYRLPLSS